MTFPYELWGHGQSIGAVVNAVNVAIVKNLEWLPSGNLFHSELENHIFLNRQINELSMGHGFHSYVCLPVDNDD